MKLVLSIIIAGLLTIGCAGISKKTEPCPCSTADTVTLKVVDQTGKKATIGEAEAKIIVTNTKTKQSWEFSSAEYKLFTQGWKNWRTVSAVDPEVSSFTEDKKFYYITFNYYKIEDNGRTKTSVLSGRIILDKSGFVESDSCKRAKNFNWWSGGYGVIITIVAVCLAVL